MTKQEFGEKYITRADVNKLISSGAAKDELIRQATTLVSAHPILDEILKAEGTSGETQTPTEPEVTEPTPDTPDTNEGEDKEEGGEIGSGDEGLLGNPE